MAQEHIQWAPKQMPLFEVNQSTGTITLKDGSGELDFNKQEMQTSIMSMSSQ